MPDSLDPPDDLGDLVAEIRLTDDAVTVTLVGELDVHTAGRLHRSLATVVAEGADVVRVHLDGLGFADSTGLGVLVAAWKAQRANGGDLELVCHQARIRRLLDVTGLDQVLTVLPTSDVAGPS